MATSSSLNAAAKGSTKRSPSLFVFLAADALEGESLGAVAAKFFENSGDLD